MYNFRAFLSLFLVLTFFSSCNKQSGEESIKIGAILPLTGRLSVIGEGEKKGLMLALDSLKTKYPAKKIELIFEDFASETKNAVTAANKLISINNVDAIITSTTAACEAVSPIVEEKNVIHFVISPDLDILKKSKTNFRVYYNFLTEAKVVNKFISQHSPKSISFLAVRYSSIQKEIEEVIEPFVTKSKINILSKDYFDITEKKFHTLIAKVKGLNPDLLFLAPQVNQVELLSNQLIENKFLPSDNNKFIASFTYVWRPRTYIETLNDFYILSPKFQVSDSANVYSDAFYKRYNEIPNFDMMYAYDNLNILVELLIQTNEDIGKFEKAFNSFGEYVGASGRIKFVGNNDTDVEVVLTQVKSGKQIEIELE